MSVRYHGGNRPRKLRHGAAAVEFAITAPIFFLFVGTHAIAILVAIFSHVGVLPAVIGDTARQVTQTHSQLGLLGMLALMLKAYSMGISTQRTKGDAEAIPFFRRALELDPNFPVAYAGLGVVYGNLNQASLAAENLKKAYALRDRVSEREKYRIASMYYSGVTGELDQALQVYEVWARSYPRDAIPVGNQGDLASKLGQFEKALSKTKEGLGLDANVVANYGNLVLYNLALNRIDDAKKAIEQAQEHKLDGDYLHQEIYYLSFLKGDTAEMERQLAWAAGRPGAEDLLLSFQSDTEAYYGRLTNAQVFSRRAIGSAIRAGSKETAAMWQANVALREAEFGNATNAKQGAVQALALSPGRDVKLFAALTFAE